MIHICLVNVNSTILDMRVQMFKNIRACISESVKISSILLLSFSLSFADSYSSHEYLSGDWNGGRKSLYDVGMDVKLSYTAEPAASVAGGYEQGATYLHNINAQITADLQKLACIENTTFMAKFSSRNGQNLSQEYVVPSHTEDSRYVYGEYFNKSQEVYGGQKTKLVNFQITTQLRDDFSLDFGRLVINDYFLRSEVYCDFMSNSICGGPKGIFTPYALSAYPDATMGLHVKYNVVSMLDIHLGLFDGGWTKQEPTGFDWSLGKNGAVITAEAQLFLKRGATYGDNRVIKIGMNHHSGTFDSYKDDKSISGSSTLYILADFGIYSEKESENQGLSIFGSYIHNLDDEIAALNDFFNIGLVYRGLIYSRDEDKLGLNYVYAKHSKYNKYTHDFISDKVRGDESIIELSYNMIFPYGISVMPDFQFIHNPNGSEDFDDVTVLAAKININF